MRLCASTLSSVRSDWGSGLGDNAPDDIVVEDAAASYTDYGVSSSFSCDSEGCE